MAELIAAISTFICILLVLALSHMARAAKLYAGLIAELRKETELHRRKYRLLESDFHAVQQQRDSIQQTLTVLNQDLEANRGTWKRDDGKTLEICGLWPMGQRKERVH